MDAEGRLRLPLHIEEDESESGSRFWRLVDADGEWIAECYQLKIAEILQWAVTSWLKQIEEGVGHVQ